MTTTETKRSVGVIGILIGILGYFKMGTQSR